ncbi:MAG: LCP family protein [Fimbriimonadaceae bacterium]|nr:LCP family protein [Fimbriimonadaceae bacterium]
MDETPKKPAWKKAIRAAGYLVLMAVLLSAALAFGWMGSNKTVQGVVSGMMGRPPGQVFQSDGITLLILGCDTELKPGTQQVANRFGRSDLMLLVRVDFDRNRITGVSIPRDLRIDVRRMGLEGYGRQTYTKINSLNVHGGPELTARVVEDLLRIRIDRTIMLDFEAFKDLIDRLGGVEVEVDREMKYVDNWGGLNIDLQPGLQTLDGDQAMGFVRFRKAAGESDFTRQERQHKLIVAVKDRIMARPAMLPEVANRTVEILGNALTGQELGSLIWFARSVPSSEIKMVGLPTREVSRSPFFLALRPRAAEEVLIEQGLLPGAPSTAEDLEPEGETNVPGAGV